MPAAIHRRIEAIEATLAAHSRRTAGRQAASSEAWFASLSNFTARQWQATRATETRRFVLFGGSRGPGKSRWLRWALLYHLLRWNANGHHGVRVMLACESYPTLRERQAEKIRTEFPSWLGVYLPSRTEFVLDDVYGGGVIALRNLDKPDKYQSAEFAAIGVDELPKNPERTFHVLRGSLRWPGVEETRFLAASNPAPGWVRDYWIEHNFPTELQGVSSDFAYVPALPQDNPYLPESYWRELDTLPPVLRAAWRDGDWYAGVEGIVFPEFSQDNICEDEPDSSQPIEVAFDDGYIDPRAILLIQRTGTRVLVFDELYQTKRLSEASVADLVERCQQHGVPRPELAVGSPEAKELQQRFRLANIASRCQQSRLLERIKHMRGMICDGNGYRALQVHRRCRHLIAELTSGYCYPPNGGEIPQDGHDHAIEALGHWLYIRARNKGGR